MPTEPWKPTISKAKLKCDSRKPASRVKSKVPLKLCQSETNKDKEIIRLRLQVNELKTIIREKLFGSCQYENIVGQNQEKEEDSLSLRSLYLDCKEFSDDSADYSSDDCSNGTETTVLGSEDEMPPTGTIDPTPEQGVFKKICSTVCSITRWKRKKCQYSEKKVDGRIDPVAAGSGGDFTTEVMPRCESFESIRPWSSPSLLGFRLQHPNDAEFKGNKHMQAAAKELKELSHLINWHENRIAEANKTFHHLQTEIETFNEQVKTEERERKWDNFMKKVLSLKTDLDDIAKPGVEIATTSDKLALLKFEMKDKILEIKKLKEQLNRAQAFCHERNTLIQEMSASMKKMKEESNQRKLKMGDLKKDLQRVTSQMQRLKKTNEELVEAVNHTEKSTSDIAKYSVWQAYNCKVQFRSKYSKATAMLQTAEEKIASLFSALEELLRRACDFYVTTNLNEKQIPKHLSIVMASSVLRVENKDVESLLEKKPDEKSSVWITCCKQLSDTEGFSTEMSGMLFEVLKVFFTGCFFDGKT